MENERKRVPIEILCDSNPVVNPARQKTFSYATTLAQHLRTSTPSTIDGLSANRAENGVLALLSTPSNLALHFKNR